MKNAIATGPDLPSQRIWLLRLVLPVRHGRLLTGLLLLSVLLPFFYLGVVETVEHRTPALFFSLIIAYIIPVFSFITAKSKEALLDLRPILDLDDLAFTQAQARLDSVSLRQTALILGWATLAGCAHIVFYQSFDNAELSEMFNSVTGMVAALGTLMVWIVMTTVIVMLIQQNVLFGRLGRNNARLSLLETGTLLPFARVSIISSLAIIGALALFPLIGFESGLNLAESLPGVIAVLVPLVVMFVIPVWPVHQRLSAMKAAELAALTDKIGGYLNVNGGVDLEPENLQQLSPLLSYRREIAEVSTWPFDIGNLTTLMLYLIIPPMTWIGAALIENLVDSLL